MTAIDAQALGDMMDGDEGEIASALCRSQEHEVALQNATDVMRYANSVVADCLDLLDRRATTPEANRELALSKLLALAKEIKRAGVLS
jgi:hypothetical protein